MKILFSKKTDDEGSALLVVIVFLTIISMFISTLILYGTMKQKLITCFGYENQTWYNAKSVLTLTKKEYENFLMNKKYESQIFNRLVSGQDTSIAYYEPWGFYILCHTKSTIKNIISERSFLLANRPSANLKGALTLGNISNPLVVTGQTKIVGDVHVGMQGVKKGSLKGRRFIGTNPVEGKILRDDKSYLPKLNLDIIEEQKMEFSLKVASGNRQEFISMNGKVELNGGVYEVTQRDFDQLTEEGINKIVGNGIIYSNQDISISGLDILGQVIIFIPHGSVFIGKGISTNNILIMADQIILSGDKELSGQFIAENHLEVKNGTSLIYPSILCLAANKEWPKERELKIESNTLIEGMVMLYNPGSPRHKIIIDKTSMIYGFIYSNHYTEVYGAVSGGIYTQSFHFYERPTIYIDWLKDVTINRLGIKQDIPTPLVFNEHVNLEVLKEL